MVFYWELEGLIDRLLVFPVFRMDGSLGPDPDQTCFPESRLGSGVKKNPDRIRIYEKNS